MPLYVIASTVLSADTCHLVTVVVRSNCFVPSARIVGASSCAPNPSVAAGNAAIESFIAWSICSGVIADPEDESPAAAEPVAVPDPRCSIACMPDA